MGAAPKLLAVALALAMAPVAAARPGDPGAQARDLVERLQSEDRVERAYAAIAVRGLARRWWRSTLLDDVELRPWQRQMAPAIPHLIEMLRDDNPLQWVDTNDQPVSGTPTTLRREAALALVALERPSVEPLIAALDDAELAPHALEVLRQIVDGGPPEGTRAAWAGFWAEAGRRPLRNERGQGWLLAVLAAAFAAVLGSVVWRQRARARARRPALSVRA